MWFANESMDINYMDNPTDNNNMPGREASAGSPLDGDTSPHSLKPNWGVVLQHSYSHPLPNIPGSPAHLDHESDEENKPSMREAQLGPSRPQRPPLKSIAHELCNYKSKITECDVTAIYLL
jgi:hypothetical protein